MRIMHIREKHPKSPKIGVSREAPYHRGSLQCPWLGRYRRKPITLHNYIEGANLKKTLHNYIERVTFGSHSPHQIERILTGHVVLTP